MGYAVKLLSALNQLKAVRDLVNYVFSLDDVSFKWAFSPDYYGNRVDRGGLHQILYLNKLQLGIRNKETPYVAGKCAAHTINNINE